MDSVVWVGLGGLGLAEFRQARTSARDDSATAGFASATVKGIATSTMCGPGGAGITWVFAAGGTSVFVPLGPCVTAQAWFTKPSTTHAKVSLVALRSICQICINSSTILYRPLIRVNNSVS